MSPLYLPDAATNARPRRMDRVRVQTYGLTSWSVQTSGLTSWSETGLLTLLNNKCELNNQGHGVLWSAGKMQLPPYHGHDH